VAQTGLEGGKKLALQLRKLGEVAEGKIVAQAAAFAMTPVASAARKSAPRGSRMHKTYKGRLVAPGFLSRSIKKKTRRWKNNQGATVIVGPTNEAFYGTSFVELGTKNAAAEAWLVPAFESRQGQVVNRFMSRIRQKIKAAAR